MGFFDFLKGKKAADDPLSFQKLAIEVARGLPFVERVEAHADEDFALDLDSEGRPGQIMYLHNLWAMAEGESLDDQRAIIAGFLEQMQAQMPIPENWETAKDRVFLALRDATHHMSLLGREGFDAVSEPVLEDLLHVLCADLETTIVSVGNKQLEEWGVSLGEAWAVALANTARFAPHLEPAEAGAMMRIQAGTIDAASYLMAPGWLERIADGRHVLAWAAERDWINVLVLDDELPYAAFAELALKEWEEASRSISPRLYTLAKGEVVPVTLPPDHEAFGALELARYKHRATQYAIQKEELDRWHEENDVDIFVASFMVYETEDGYRSVVAWPDECLGLLPEVDVAILMSDDGQPTEIPFEALVEAAGIAPSKTLFPRRYRVERWPDREVLAELSAAFAG